VQNRLLLLDFGGVIVRLGFADFYRGLSSFSLMPEEGVKEAYENSGLEIDQLSGLYNPERSFQVANSDQEHGQALRKFGFSF